MGVAFAKYQGLGNDFIIVDADAWGSRTPPEVTQICDRHLGVGADGVLVARREGSLWRMEVFNADGSRPQMCGNGLRCFVRWLLDTARLSDHGAIEVLTDAGPRRCWAEGDEVRIEMGFARFERQALPMLGSGAAIEQLNTPWGEALEVRGVSVGNPHAVVWQQETRGPEAAARAGRWVCEHALFPEQVNVEFVSTREDGSLGVVVYERGCGLTQACGTGAVAVVADWVRQNPSQRIETERAVDLPGGRLWVRQAADGMLWLRGPAVRVFEGFWGL